MSTEGDTYKIVSYATAQLEANLNRLAREGWRVIYQHFDPMAKGSHQWHVMLERIPEKRR